MSWVKTQIERLTGLHIYRNSLPKGVNVNFDLAREFNILPGSTIVDIGANEGQSIPGWRIWFKPARLIAVEPQPELAAKLRAVRPPVEVVQCALSSVSQAGAALYVPEVKSDFSSQLASLKQEHLPSDGLRSIPVVVETLDQIFERLGIGEVLLLKIDTEGNDVRVLQGGQQALASGRVKFIQTECTFGTKETFHSSLSELSAFLLGFGYRLYRIYDQADSYVERELMYANALFFHHTLNARFESKTS